MKPANLPKIARDALKRRGIVADPLQPIVDGLTFATMPGTSFVVQSQRRATEEHKRRSTKIKTLERLLDSYAPDRVKSHPAMPFASDSHASLQSWHGRDLDQLLGDLEALLAAERTLLAIIPTTRIDPNHPETNKALGARLICEALMQRGVKRWTACSVIAELFIAIGIESKSPDRVQRALYDRLRRLVD